MDLRCLVDGKACAGGSRDRHRLVEDCAAERLDIIASENSLPLESERRDRIRDCIDQQLPPRQRLEVRAQERAERRPGKESRERPSEHFLPY
jgi:hypothetical protein